MGLSLLPPAVHPPPAPHADSFMPKRGKKGEDEDEGKGVIHEE